MRFFSFKCVKNKNIKRKIKKRKKGEARRLKNKQTRLAKAEGENAE